MSLLLIALLIADPSLTDRAEKAVQDAKPTTTEVTSAVQQPAKDIGLVKDVVPPPIRKAAEAPYDPSTVPTCRAISDELKDLDKALGPDVDAPAEHSDTKGLAGDFIRGALQIPFSNIVRRLSGASRREEAYRRAVAAGMVRRGFLKGRAGALGCPVNLKGGPPN